MIIALIERNSNSGEEPSIILADDEIGARRAAADQIISALPAAAAPGVDEDDEDDDEGDINYIGGVWVRDNPVPDLDDAPAVEKWLDAFKEATTDMWLSLHEDTSVTDVRNG